MKGKKHLISAILCTAFLVLSGCTSSSTTSGSDGNSNNNIATHSISGTVTSSGAGLSGVSVALGGSSSARATTDANGNYSFAGLVSGAYVITPSKLGYTFSPASSSQTVNSANISSVDFSANAATTSASSLVGSWQAVYGAFGLDNNATYSGAAWIFYPNGTYTAWDSDTSSQDPGGVCGDINGDTGLFCTAGREWGTYNYDAVNHVLTATSTIDENGANGFTHNAGETWTSQAGAFTVNGDVISVVIGTTTVTLERVADTSNPIVGSWIAVYGVFGLDNAATTSKAAWTFYPNGTYTAWDSDTSSQDPGGVCGDINGDTGLFCTAGREWGTYRYDAVNHVLTATSTIDENGANGFTHNAGETWTSQAGVFTVNGDVISVVIGTTTVTLERVR